MTDYERITEAISFISSHVTAQPRLEEIADHVHLSPFHFQRLFSRWAGITPKRFLEVLTVEHAKALLDGSGSLLEVSEEIGLSSSSRLHEHFVHLEAVTPGEYRSRGDGLVIEYGVHDTPFGAVLVAVTARGICDLAFLPGQEAGDHLDRIRARWPGAEIRAHQARTRPPIDALFGKPRIWDRPLSLYVSGTNFQTRVWGALLSIPPGSVVSYAQVATAIGHPGAARAVGAAVGANTVAFLIPCHRVICQDGTLGGYRWGAMRKRAMLAWEAARCR